MLYHLFNWLKENYDFTGAGVFQYISFRASMALIFSLLIATIYGRRLINLLKRAQIGEEVRDLGLEGQQEKKGTPTMGGIIILLAILVPTILFADLTNVYVQLMLLCTVWMGVIGLLDDTLKIRSKKKAMQSGGRYEKKDKDGLAGMAKIIGQVGLGIIIGSTLYFSQDVVIERPVINQQGITQNSVPAQNEVVREVSGREKRYVKANQPITTIPFVKNHEFNYSKIISWMGEGADKFTWLVYILIVTFIIVAVSNGANLTDGIDGLAGGVSGIIGFGMFIFIYVSGNYILSDYLNIMYIPNISDLTIFTAALMGGCVGFLWYNAYPAQVFMGDTGSLALGGIIASLAIIVRKELLIPIFCGIFLLENLSVILQVSYFKYTKKKFGEGRRIFLMSPMHHHYQKKGYHENKISVRFWIVSIILVVFSIATLKMR
ncbi:phospho-N-acetylmuramoyl-pentapeptide-transferase [Haoranjiania flava]|uniref:Phospho-N-acetylmuramoyl-pentapeptide-transferase n=1 Tax=Haoranjiania flava TaxID=1856322 RepID=A0AAE3LK96_9BACT|nr:phospho-N-acetylmuramoyl-pentapeptide-transferase [Haoranjiania flava]MCU7694378.1 phospho-N-acetylmuramoyl-pentapeptide-transferase [Haoranjiania flava]